MTITAFYTFCKRKIQKKIKFVTIKIQSDHSDYLVDELFLKHSSINRCSNNYVWLDLGMNSTQTNKNHPKLKSIMRIICIRFRSTLLVQLSLLFHCTEYLIIF